MLNTTLVAAIGARAATVMLAILALIAVEAKAHHHSTPHPFKQASIAFDPGGEGRPAPAQILVGHDGSKYTRVIGEISARFRIRAEVKSGHRIFGWVVTTWSDPQHDVQDVAPHTIGANAGEYDRTIDKHVTFRLPAVTAINTGIPGISLDSREQQIVDQCNSAFATPPPTDQAAGEIQLEIHVAFSSGKKQAWGTPFADWTYWPSGRASGRPGIAFTTLPVQIVCLNKTDPRVADLKPKAVNVDIRVEPTGDRCPKETKVTAYVDYTEKATSRLRANYNGQFGGFRAVETREVSFAGKTWHRAEFTFTYYLDPGEHKFRIEVEDGPNSRWEAVNIACPPFEVLSAWMKYEVEDKLTCPKKVIETVTFKATRPGTLNYEIKHQGGLVVHKSQAEVKRQGLDYVAVATRNLTMHAFDAEIMADVKNSPANSGWVRLKVDCLEVLGGTLDLRDANGPACPRHAEVAFSIRTNMAAPIAYSVDCTGGRSWTGTAPAHKTAPDTFIAVGVLPFAIKHNEQVSCALKSTLQSPPKIIALRGRHYECIKRSVEPAGGGLVSDPRPPSTKPEGPRIVVDPPRPICVGGRLITTGSRPVRYSCHCSAGQTAEATGPASYRCQGKPTVGITCGGGTVRNGQCLCPSHMKKVQAGHNAWRCISAHTTAPSAAGRLPRLSASRTPGRPLREPSSRPK